MGGPVFTKVFTWIKEYGGADSDDSRAVKDFMEVETRELVNTFRAELTSISKGNFDESKMDVMVGVNRKSRHGGYDRWAKMMLLWMAEYKG